MHFGSNSPRILYSFCLKLISPFRLSMPSLFSNHRPEVSRLTLIKSKSETALVSKPKELDICFTSSDPETASLLSEGIFKERPENLILPTQKALPLISFILFTMVNILPGIISCSIVSGTECLRVKLFENSYFFKWTFVVHFFFHHFTNFLLFQS